jgi:formylglycine-generating enzyme required for sulfatase activity
VEFKDMVRVPKGKALLGKNKREVYVPEFYIDRTEVSNRAYAKFLSASPQHPRPHDFEENDNPVVSVSFYDAQDFAKWAQKRLPTEEEWQKAARGTDGRAYPWGNDEDAGKANLNSTGVTPVDSFPNGASPYGALNMCGNVWEWVDTTTQPTPETLIKMQAKDPSIKSSDIFYMLKGWSYRQRWTPSLLWEHSEHRPDYHAASIGFRCARTP